MSIKSDKWIRKMAEMHNMITPFESRQVRHSEKWQNNFAWQPLVMVTISAARMNSKFLPILIQLLLTRKILRLRVL